jgi:hypothetical protein
MTRIVHAIHVAEAAVGATVYLVGDLLLHRHSEH